MIAEQQFMPLKFSSLKSWLTRFSGRALAKPFIESNFVDSEGTDSMGENCRSFAFAFPLFPPRAKKVFRVWWEGLLPLLSPHLLVVAGREKWLSHLFPPQASPVLRMRTTKIRFTRNWLLSWALLWIYHILIAWQTNVPIYPSVCILGNYVKRQCPKLVKIKTVIFSSQVIVNQNQFSRLCLIQVSSPHLLAKEEWTSKLCKVLPQKSHKILALPVIPFWPTWCYILLMKAVTKSNYK